VTGTLDIAATPADRFTINAVFLSGTDPGPPAGSFDLGEVFMIASTTGGVVGFEPGAFVVQSSEFAHSFAVTSDGMNVYLSVVPEPSALALAALGLLALVAHGWRRRRQAV